MYDEGHEILLALQSMPPGGERFQRVMIAFERFLSKHIARLTTVISSRARLAGLDPNDALSETLNAAFEHLRNQAEGKAAKFAFTGDPGFEGWFLLVASGLLAKTNSQKPRQGGVIRTLLTQKVRRAKREVLTNELNHFPQAPDDETAAILRCIDLEQRLSGLSATDRCLFELDSGALNASPTAETVIGHARLLGISETAIASMRRRAARMTWRQRRNYKVSRAELAMLFGMPEREVRNRIRSALALLRNGIDTELAAPPHWSPACGRRTSVAESVF